MDDPRDEHTAVPTPAAARDRGRVVRALGSGAVWALGVFVVLVSLVTLGTILFSRRPEASRLAIEFVNRALAGASDLRLTAERTLLLEHGARIVHPRLAVIDSAGRAQTLLEAADLSIGTSWGGLLRGRPDAFLIDLREARLTLRRRPDGSLVLPRFRGTGRPPELDARLDLDIRSHGLTVLLLDGVAPAETLATGVEGVVRARQRGPRWEISLSGLRGRAPAAGLARAKVEGRALYSGGEFELTRLRIETDAGWIAGKGRGRVTPRLDLAGRVEVGEVTWTRLAHWTGQEALDLAGGIAGGFSWHARGDSLAIAGARFDVLWRNEPAAATFNQTQQPCRAETKLEAEVYSNGRPNLIVVGHDSLYIYALTRQPTCAGETWGCVLLDVPAVSNCPAMGARDWRPACNGRRSNGIHWIGITCCARSGDKPSG